MTACAAALLPAAHWHAPPGPHQASWTFLLSPDLVRHASLQLLSGRACAERQFREPGSCQEVNQGGAGKQPHIMHRFVYFKDHRQSRLAKGFEREF